MSNRGMNKTLRGRAEVIRALRAQQLSRPEIAARLSLTTQGLSDFCRRWGIDLGPRQRALPGAAKQYRGVIRRIDPLRAAAITEAKKRFWGAA